MLDSYTFLALYLYMIYEGNIMRTIDIEFFDMTTNTFVPFGRGKKTTKWKEDDVLDQIFTKLAKKVEKNT